LVGSRRIEQRFTKKFGITGSQAQARTEDTGLVPPARVGVAKAIISQLDDIYYDLIE